MYFGRGAKPKLLFSGKIIVSDEKTSFCEFFAEVACMECVATENERKIIVTNVSGLCLRRGTGADAELGRQQNARAAQVWESMSYARRLAGTLALPGGTLRSFINRLIMFSLS